MRDILQNRPLKLIFLANMISMFGSGLNSTGVTWYILQRTHSEMSLGVLLFLQTLPALLLLPFSGVIIDREDRRHLVMLLDAVRGLAVLGIALLALLRPQYLMLWHVYALSVLVAAGFWMFWPTINALIQEMSPGGDYVRANTFLMAGVQGGWLIAGAVVGFLYDRIGIGGVLLIDALTYAVSLSCYLFVRRGRQVVSRPEMSEEAKAALAEGPVAHFVHELHEGIAYLKSHRYLQTLGVSWAMFLGAMMTSGVITAPLSERILHGGAIAYGWLNAGWGTGAFVSVLYTAAAIRLLHARRALALGMGTLALGACIAPFSHFVALAVVIYFIMGSCRGFGGVALSSATMELVPKHFMGRIQNTFYFVGTFLQLITGLGVGYIAHHFSLTAGFFTVATMYGVACLAALVPVPMSHGPTAAEPAADMATL
jgi:MFS family permease